MSTTIILNNVRLSHPHLWTPAPPMKGSNSGPKYDGSFLFPHNSPQAKIAQDAFFAEAAALFGPNWQNIVAAMDKGKKCLRNGDQKLTKEGTVSNGYAGHMFLVAKNSKKPAVIAHKFHDGKPVEIDAAGKGYVDGMPVQPAFKLIAPYGGCYVNAKIEIYAMNKGELQGVYATLLGVQFHNDGESFGGGEDPNADGFGEGDYGSESAGANAFGAPAAAPAANLFG